MIRIENLVTGYGKHAITSNLNARLVAGELVSLLGRNGVGKSTLLRTLCGFQPPLGGKILLYGQDICTISQAGLSRKIGVVLTERPDTGNMTVREMVEMGRSPYTGFWGRLDRHDSETVQWAMRLAGIEDMQGRRVRTLSDGERQKTMIAKALAQETPIILLDEPTAFLDFQSKAETMRLLSNLAHEQRKVIFLSTHDVEMAMADGQGWRNDRNARGSVLRRNYLTIPAMQGHGVRAVYTHDAHQRCRIGLFNELVIISIRVCLHTLGGRCHKSLIFRLMMSANSWFFSPHLGATTYSGGLWLTKRSRTRLGGR